jgi:hypothetical protein
MVASVPLWDLRFSKRAQKDKARLVEAGLWMSGGERNEIRPDRIPFGTRRLLKRSQSRSSSPEQVVDGEPGPEVLVTREDDGRPALLLGDLDGHDLVGEQTGPLGSGHAALGFQGIFVLILAADAVTLRHDIGRVDQRPHFRRVWRGDQSPSISRLARGWARASGPRV